MHARLLPLLASVVVSGCASLPTNFYLPETEYKGFISIDPVEYPHEIEVYDTRGYMQVKNIRALEKDEVLKALSNETVLVVVREMAADGSVTFGPAQLSKKHSQYFVTMDYMKFTTVAIQDPLVRELRGTARLGVGLRIVARITSHSDGVNLGDLISIGVAAQRRQVSGSLSVEIIGISSSEVTATLPLPSEISTASIQAALQAMATIKSKIYDTDTRLSPKVMAVKAEKDDVRILDLKENMIERQQALLLALDQEIAFFIPENFRGVWEGTGTQDTKETFDITITLTDTSAHIEYSVPCSGIFTLLTSERPDQLRYREHITSGIDVCWNFGSGILKLNSQNEMGFTWHYPGGRLGVIGDLTRKEAEAG